MAKVDRIWISYSGYNPDTSGFDNPANPEDYDDIMKFSNCTSAFATGKEVAGGQENALDIVRGSDYRFHDCSFAAAPVAAATIKGAVSGWTMTDCSCPTIELGMYDNYWVPGRAPTRGGKLVNMRGKVKVVCWDAEPPLVVNSAVKVTKVPRFIWFPYFFIKYLFR